MSVVRFDGYVLGEPSPESGEMEVCPHDSPLGWACMGCGEDRGKVHPVPARRSDPPRSVIRAVCDHCRSRVWLDAASIPEEIRKEAMT